MDNRSGLRLIVITLTVCILLVMCVGGGIAYYDNKLQESERAQKILDNKRAAAGVQCLGICEKLDPSHRIIYQRDRPKSAEMVFEHLCCMDKCINNIVTWTPEDCAKEQ